MLLSRLVSMGALQAENRQVTSNYNQNNDVILLIQINCNGNEENIDCLCLYHATHLLSRYHYFNVALNASLCRLSKDVHLNKTGAVFVPLYCAKLLRVDYGTGEFLI